ncbi:MAG: SPFH domain-containing protein, partial [Lachnospiraceae bacterium]|nr:SPFH domain-containing protein [Lachnospiraceae bacterium]
MEEKILTGKKNGMAALFGIILLYILALAGIIAGNENPVLFIAGMVVIVLASILWGGLKVLKPQEALVLTLFGKYVGTLKEDGFYFVNPFCTSVNPAARTRLS